MSNQTVKDLSGQSTLPAPNSAPGLVVVFSGTSPTLVPIPWNRGRIELGRTELQELGFEDSRVSRKHLVAELTAEAVRLWDQGSTNGTFVAGQRVSTPVAVPRGAIAVVRLGQTIVLVVWNLHAYLALKHRDLTVDGVVSGVELDQVHQQIAAQGRAGHGLFIRGESGSGKEIAARVFHQAGPRAQGPFVAVNCAAIPKDLSERLLFGAVRGAYSGAFTDAQGYFQAAHGGTLFLDEVSELDLAVQAKLLRVLESRAVTPLGSTRAQQVEFGLCTATFKDLREAVLAGAFREDLYYRIGRPEVRLPPLRERLEELPFLASLATRAVGLQVTASVVEECLLRPWPGNIRELLAELRATAVRAQAKGAAEVLVEHLDEQAGRSLRSGTVEPEVRTPAAGNAPHKSIPPEGTSARVSAACVELGIARKTLAKLLPDAVLHTLLTSSDAEHFTDRLRASAAEALLTLLETSEFNHSAVSATLGTSRTTLLKLIEDLGLPRASELADETITQARDAADGDLGLAAGALRVSLAALKKRLATRPI